MLSFVSRIPEKFSLGKFDYLFHVTNVVLNSNELYTVQLDFQLFYSILTYSDFYVDSFNSTFFLFSIFFYPGLLSMAVVIYFLVKMIRLHKIIIYINVSKLGLKIIIIDLKFPLK